MKKHILFALASLLSFSAFAQERSEAPLPRTFESSVHLSPVYGAASFSGEDAVIADNFDRGTAAGILVDLGARRLSFETGALQLTTSAQRQNAVDVTRVQSLAVPLFVKYNLSGNPKSTVFVKGGAVSLFSSDFPSGPVAMAAGGIGGALPLGRNSALTVDATYNQLVAGTVNLNDYNGFIVLGGLTIGM